MTTVCWLLQSTEAHTDLAFGRAPAGLLGPAEANKLAGLAVPKRRRDWLLGRWTAKHLLQTYLAATTGVTLALCELVIGNDADGAPYVNFNGHRPLSLSISHCDGHAFCAVAAASPSRPVGEEAVTGQTVTAGADMERIETRGWEFIDDFFTMDEIAQVREASLAERDTRVTAIWSAKEAVLKALHVGLTVDTRCVSVTLDTNLRPLDGAKPPFGMSSNGGGMTYPAGAMDFTVENWRRFDVVLANPLDLGLQDQLRGWWGLYGTYVLTLVLKEG